MKDAVGILSRYWGYSSFRSPQDKVVQALINNKDVIALMPTGGGKSICFQVPALMKEGLCIVISPLIALIKDQVNALNDRGIRATDLSGNLSSSEIERRMDNCIYGDYKFLYLSPERLENEWVRSVISQMKVSLIAIDEAHCISHWGKDFRPSYLRCGVLRELFPKVPIIALTATATQQIVDDIEKSLHLSETVKIKGSLFRNNLIYNVLQVDDKWSALHHYLNTCKGSAIVYLRSRKGVEQMAEYLNRRDISATFFHGGLSSEQKNIRLGMWMLNDVRIMVATNAFGMGIDKPDVRLVIHWDIPSSLEDYFQEVGRAGRDGQLSQGILLYNSSDISNFKRNFENSLTDISFLKKVYYQLNQYFLLAYGEGQGKAFQLRLVDFCNKNQWSVSAVFSALQVLDRLGICTLFEQYKNQCRLQILLPYSQLVQYIQSSSSKKQKELLLYLTRKDASIYNSLTKIDEDALAEYLSVSVSTLQDNLLRLKEREIINYVPKSTDLELVFNVPRSDDNVINFHSYQVKLLNKIKEEKYQAMLHFLKNDTQCLSVQMMGYFGEHNATPCMMCSVCKTQHKGKSNSELIKISKNIYEYMKESPLTIYEIQQKFILNKDEVIFIVDYLIDEQLIEKQIDNSYQSK